MHTSTASLIALAFSVHLFCAAESPPPCVRWSKYVVQDGCMYGVRTNGDAGGFCFSNMCVITNVAQSPVSWGRSGNSAHVFLESNRWDVCGRSYYAVHLPPGFAFGMEGVRTLPTTLDVDIAAVDDSNIYLCVAASNMLFVFKTTVTNMQMSVTDCPSWDELARVRQTDRDTCPMNLIALKHALFLVFHRGMVLRYDKTQKQVSFVGRVEAPHTTDTVSRLSSRFIVDKDNDEILFLPPMRWVDKAKCREIRMLVPSDPRYERYLGGIMHLHDSEPRTVSSVKP